LPWLKDNLHPQAKDFRSSRPQVFTQYYYSRRSSPSTPSHGVDGKVSKLFVPHDHFWYHPRKAFEIELGNGQYMLIWMKNVGDGKKDSIRGSKAFRAGMREIAEDQLEGKTSY
jgi:hypothetical protein